MDYNFKLGDVFKPVGLVTAKLVLSLINDFELTVTEVFSDQYSSWNFGQFDFIDSIKIYKMDKELDSQYSTMQVY